MGKTDRVRRATHIGRSHLLNFTNCQDALALFDGELNYQRLIIGIVCDGCSEGTNSEVGANLASAYLIREIVQLLKQGVPATVIPNLLYTGLVDFLRGILSGYSFANSNDRVAFIRDNMLFTVVGFIMTDNETVVFITGDGTIIVNDDVTFVDANNRPSYPGYHLVERSALEVDASALPTNFDVEVFSTDEVFRLAIGSDAWADEPQLIDQIWGYKHPAGLQRRINQWSKTDKKFRDDVSIITVEIIETPETEEEIQNGSCD